MPRFSFALIVLSFFFVARLSAVNRTPSTDSIKFKIDNINHLFSALDSMESAGVNDENENIFNNLSDSVSILLESLFNDKRTRNYSVEKLLKNFSYITPDKKIGTVAWQRYTGGRFDPYEAACVTFCRLPNGNSKANDECLNDVYASYLLKTGKSIEYLLLSKDVEENYENYNYYSNVGTSTITLVSLTDDGLNNQFSASISYKGVNNETKKPGNLLKFDYDTLSQIFTIKYIKDDINDDKGIEDNYNNTVYTTENGDTVTAHYVFSPDENDSIEVSQDINAGGKGGYIHGRKNGEWISYDVRDSGKTITNYVNGKKEGYEKSYFNDGKVFSSAFYHEDTLLNGKYELWWHNGKYRELDYYKNGNREGKWKEWDSTGRLLSKGKYVHNIPVGKFLRWNEKGIIISEQNYKKGMRDGECKEWDEKGNLTSDKIYHNGEMVKVIK